jgi:hypothetical protein
MVIVESPERTIEPLPAPGRSGAMTAIVLAIALLPPLTQVAYLLLRDRESWPFLFSDDAFYYFGVARSIGTGDGSTFSGLVETNGYHPLWMVVLSAVAAVVRDPYGFLAAVVVVQGLIWFGVVGQAMRIGRLLGSEASAVAGLSLLGVLAVLTGQLSFNGMESAPLILLLLIVVRLILEMGDAHDRQADLRLGLVLALVFLARLDAVFTTVPLAAIAAQRGGVPFRSALRRGVALLGPTAIAVAGYVSVNLVWFGTPTPVSGQAKSLGAPFRNLAPVEQFLKAGQVGQRPVWFGAFTLALLALAWVVGAWRHSTPARRLIWCAGGFLLGQALLLTYLVVATSYQVWAWYYYDVALLAFCAGTLFALWGLSRTGSVARAGCLVLGAAFATAQAPITFWSEFTNRPEAVATAMFVNDELSKDAVIAMGDRAGVVGYLANRPMLQVEGLVADAAWLDNLDAGTAAQRLTEEGVDHYLWSGVVPGPVILDDGRSCRRLAEPRNSGGPKFTVTVCDDDLLFQIGAGNDLFTVWRYRPELNRT